MQGYRPPAAKPKTKWAAFLDQMRQERDWNSTHAFEQLREGLNLGPKSRDSYRALELGKRPPRPDEAAFLVKFYGREPDELPATVAPEPDLTAALTAQTKAMADLVDELQRWRTEDRVRIAKLEATVALLTGAALDRPGSPAPAGPGSPRATAG